MLQDRLNAILDGIVKPLPCQIQAGNVGSFAIALIMRSAFLDAS